MPDFTKGHWSVENGIDIISDFHQNAYIAQLYLIPDEKEHDANAKLIAAAPDMYYALKKCYGFIENIISYDCKYCSRSLDAEGLRIALDDLFSSIDRSEDKGHDTHA